MASSCTCLVVGNLSGDCQLECLRVASLSGLGFPMVLQQVSQQESGGTCVTCMAQHRKTFGLTSASF